MFIYYILYYLHVFQLTPGTVSTDPGIGTVETNYIFFKFDFTHKIQYSDLK